MTSDPAAPNVRFVFTPTPEDLSQAYQRYNRTILRSRKALFVLVVTLALLFAGLAMAMPHDPVAVGGIFAMGAAGGVLVPLAMIRWRVPALARRIYAQQHDLHGPVTVAADPDTLSTTSATGESRTPWSHYLRWDEDEYVILLYRSEALFQFIPKRALAAAESDVLREFAAAGGAQAAARRSG